VVKALEQLDPHRKCFRLVGEVLVERTVKEVLPAVKSNKDQMDMVRLARYCSMALPCVLEVGGSHYQGNRQCYNISVETTPPPPSLDLLRGNPVLPAVKSKIKHMAEVRLCSMATAQKGLNVWG